MTSKFSVAAFALTMFVTTGAFAAGNVANLLDAQGKVMVDHGKGFVQASLNSGLNVGDRVFVGQNSSAVVSFEGCTLNIAKSTVYTISKQAPCAKGMKTAQIGDVFVAPAGDAPAGAGAAGAGAAGAGAAGAGAAGLGAGAFGGLGPALLIAPIALGGGFLLLRCSGVSAC